MATLKYEALATVGEYTAKDGTKKKQYLKVGTVWESDKGLSMKLDALPVGQDWSGWISFFTPKPKDGYAAPADAATTPTADSGFDDDPPF